MPVLFLSHGAPDLVLSDHPARRALEALAPGLPEPRAILCISPHWLTRGLALSDAARPQTLHDFWGFDEALYRLHYPAPGEPALARAIAAGLQADGVPCQLQERGFDHGVWSLMRLLYPDATLPVISMSLVAGQTPAAYAGLGERLKAWRDAGVLIVASGTSTHNLRALAAEGTPPPAWSLGFQQWLLEALAQADRTALLDWQACAPQARWAHPTSEHLDPLWIALGAADDPVPEVLYQGFCYGSIGLIHLRFD